MLLFTASYKNSGKIFLGFLSNNKCIYLPAEKEFALGVNKAYFNAEISLQVFFVFNYSFQLMILQLITNHNAKT